MFTDVLTTSFGFKIIQIRGWRIIFLMKMDEDTGYI